MKQRIHVAIFAKKIDAFENYAKCIVYNIALIQAVYPTRKFHITFEFNGNKLKLEGKN